jgi:hypothetical protein
MAIIGSIVLLVGALLAATFTALLLVSGWNAIREELVPGFRIDPPGPRSITLIAIGAVLPVVLIAAFITYFAIRLLGSIGLIR